MDRPRHRQASPIASHGAIEAASGIPLRDLCETAYINAALEDELRHDVRAGVIRPVVASLLNAHPSDHMHALTIRAARKLDDRAVVGRARHRHGVTQAAWLVAHIVEPLHGSLQDVPPRADIPPELVATAWIMPRTREALGILLSTHRDPETRDRLLERYTRQLTNGGDQAESAAGLLSMLAAAEAG